MKPTKVALYARISTQDQRNEGQVHELREHAKRLGWQVAGVYSDVISGTKGSRPALDRMLADARKGKFSCVVTLRIDRLGRSVGHLLAVLEKLKVLGVKFISLQEALDSETPAGLMAVTVLGAAAALERSILIERVQMGLRNARRRGVRLGRPPKKELSSQEISAIRAERSRGATLRAIAKAHGASVWSIHRVCSQRALEK